MSRSGAAPVSARERAARASAALKFVLMVGVMSFFADFTYEGPAASSAPTSACSVPGRWLSA